MQFDAPLLATAACWQRPSPLPPHARFDSRTEAQSLRPAPARPSAGASPPPGLGLDWVAPGATDPVTAAPLRAGKRMRFLIRATARCVISLSRRPQ